LRRWATERDVKLGLAESPDELIQTPKRAWYVPFKEMTEAAKRSGTQRIEIPGEGRVSLVPGAAEQRVKSAADYVRDPVVQFEKHMQEFSGKVGAATEARRLQGVLGTQAKQTAEKIDYDKVVPDWADIPIKRESAESILRAEKGVIVDVPTELKPVPGKPLPKVREEVAKLRKGLEEASGADYMHLGDALRDDLARVSGKPGLKKGAFDTLVPVHVGRRLQELSPLFGGSPAKLNEAYQHVQTINSKVLRPYMQAWRTGKTLMGGPMYYVRNTVGAFGLGGVAHGLKIFDPALQRSATLTALASAGMGTEKALARKLVLRSGEETTVGEVLRLADRVGLIDQADMRAGLEMVASGKAGGLARGMTKATEHLTPFYTPAIGPFKKLSMRNMARLSENHQKLLAFVGALDNTKSPQALARALDFTSEFAGNYARLSNFEKYALKDLFGFYSWNRFILPHILKQLVKNPQRLAPYAKMRVFARHKWGDQKQVNWRLVPDYIRDFAFPAPRQWQLEGDYNMAAAYSEDPLYMGLNLVPPLLSLMGSKAPWGQDASNAIGPIAKFTSAFATGRDPDTGEELDRLHLDIPELLRDISGGHLDVAAAKFNATAVGNMLLDPVARPSRSLSNLWKLYESRNMPLEEVELKLRYRVGRDWWILGNLLNKLTGKPLAIGAGAPGVGAVMIEGIPETARMKARAAGLMKKRERELHKPGPPTNY